MGRLSSLHLALIGAGLVAVVVLAVVLAMALSGSGGADGPGGSGGDATATPPRAAVSSTRTVVTPTAPPAESILLPGERSQPALEAIFNFDTGQGVPESEVSLEAGGSPVARTQFEVALADGVTVGQVNALLESINGRVISMVEGVPYLIVQIPDPGTLEGLDAVIARVEADPAALFVNRGYFPGTDELPGNISTSAADLALIDNHLAVGAGAAWNARGALAGLARSRPLVIVADYFGDGLVTGDFDANIVAGAFNNGNPDQHGHHVLGIITGDFGGGADARGRVTGMFPGESNVAIVDMVVDATTYLTLPQTENQILFHLGNATGNSVVSTSLNYCGGAGGNICGDPVKASQAAITWIDKVRGAVKENRFVHVTSSGNIKADGISDGETNSAFAAAKLLTGLTKLQADGTSVPVRNLSNTLVIENVNNTTVSPFGPKCLDNSSKSPGDLAAMGTDVHSFTGPTGGAGDLTGTSMATPQAAALAAYVWTMSPSLTPQQVISILTGTATPGVAPVPGDASCHASTSQPVINAYAALLAADRSSALTGSGRSADAPARSAILDAADESGALADADGTPAGNGRFDEQDVALFWNAFRASTGAVDYSRFDLNGDGVMGGSGRAAFDLNIDWPAAPGTVEQQVTGITVSFDEAGVTDLEVLCYYAYSPLFTGDETVRDNTIGELCSCGSGTGPETVLPGNIQVTNSAELAQLEGVTHITGSLFIRGDLPTSEQLTSLSGLEKLQRVDGALSILGHKVLTNLDALCSLAHVGGGLAIGSNAALEGLGGLQSLAHVGGNLIISNNAALRDLDGLQSLKRGGSTGLSILNNAALQDLDGLRSMQPEIIGGNLVIQGNAQLKNIDGLIHITGVSASVTIRDNPLLTNLDGLGSLVSVGRDLGIAGAGLTSVSGLKSLDSVGGTLSFVGMTVLELPALRTAESVSFNGAFDEGPSGPVVTLSLPSLTTLTGVLGIHSIQHGTTVNLPSLTSIALGVRVTDVTAPLTVNTPAGLRIGSSLDISNNGDGGSLTLRAASVPSLNITYNSSFTINLTVDTVGPAPNLPSYASDLTVDSNIDLVLNLRVSRVEGRVTISHNTGLSLGRIDIGSVIDSIRIVSNDGFSDDDALEFIDGIIPADTRYDDKIIGFNTP